MEDEIKGPIVVNKLRIYETRSISGLKEFQKVYGVSQGEAIRMALHLYFSGDTEKVENITSVEKSNNSANEITNILKTLKVENRIIIKKLFDLNQEEYIRFMKEAAKKFDK